MAGKQVPTRSVALEDGAVSFSVRAAARLLGVSPSMVYGYLARGKLTKYYIDERIMLREDEVLALQVQVSAAAREQRAPRLLTMRVPVRPGCNTLLVAKLEHIYQQNKHHIPGATMQCIARNENTPERLLIFLLWPGKALPSAQRCQKALAELVADLEDVCDWSQARVDEREVLSMVGVTGWRE